MISPDQLIEIARRKERLIARSEMQRRAIAADFHGLRRPIALVDRGLGVARFLGSHPALVAAVVGAVVVFRRRNLFSLASRGISAWRLWRSLSAWMA